MAYHLSVLLQLHLIPDLTPAFNGLDKYNCKTRWETLKFGIWCASYERFDVTYHFELKNNPALTLCEYVKEKKTIM